MTKRAPVLSAAWTCDQALTAVLDGLRQLKKESNLYIFAHQLEGRSRQAREFVRVVDDLKLAQNALHRVVQEAQLDESYQANYRNIDFVLRALEIMSRRLDQVTLDRGVTLAITQLQNIQNDLQSYMDDMEQMTAQKSSDLL